MNNFSSILTALRKERKLSQKQVSGDLNISQALLSHYEKGIRECSLDLLITISNYYGVSCDYLLGCSNVKARLSDASEIGNVCNSIKDLTDTVNETNDKKLISSVEKYISLSLYRLTVALSLQGAVKSDCFRFKCKNTFGISDLAQENQLYNISQRICEEQKPKPASPAVRSIVQYSEGLLAESIKEVEKQISF